MTTPIREKTYRSGSTKGWVRGITSKTGKEEDRVDWWSDLQLDPRTHARRMYNWYMRGSGGLGLNVLRSEFMKNRLMSKRKATRYSNRAYTRQKQYLKENPK